MGRLRAFGLSISSPLVLLLVVLGLTFPVAQAQSPPVPATLTATAYSKTQIDLRWNVPLAVGSGSGDAGVVQPAYAVERLGGPGSSWTPVFASGPNATGWSDTGLLTGATYSYRVRAFTKTQGQIAYSAYSPVATGTTQSALYPDPPTNLVAVVNSPTQVKLKWHDEVNKQVGYQVERAASAAGPWSRVGYVDKSTLTKITFVDASLTAGASYTYQVRATNVVGDSAPASVTVSGPTTPDLVGTLTINGGAWGTSSLPVTLNLAASSAIGVTGFYISTSTTVPAANAAGWTAVASTLSYSGSVGYNLASGDGAKTLYAWYKDTAGNVSNTATASILLDQTAPTNGTITTIAASGQVSLSWSGFADDGSGVAASSYKLVFSTGKTPSSCNSGTLLASDGTSYTHTGLNNGTTYFYRVCVADNAGNLAAGATASDTPGGVTDTSAPVGTVVINAGAAYTGSTTVTLNLSASDAVGVSAYWLSLTTTTPSSTAPGWIAVTPATNFSANVPYSLTTTDGSKTVYVWYKDAAGNVSAMASGSIILDRTAPTNGSLTATAGLSLVTLNWSGFTDAGSGLASTAPYTLVYSAVSSPASCTAGGTVTTLYTGSATTFTQSNVTTGPLYYRVCAADNVGNANTGAIASATPLVNRPPVANAGPDQTSTVGTAVFFDASASSDPDGSIVSYKFVFGDGLSLTSTTSAVVAHAYSAPGTYTMTLTVTDNLGATSTDTAQVTVTNTSQLGNFRSVKRLGGSSSDAGSAVTVDSAGNVVVVGTFSGTADFGGPGPLTSNAGSTDIFIAKYSAAGAYLCARQVGGAGDDRVFSVKTDASGNIFITGSFQGTVDFGGSVLTSAAGSVDAFVAKYSPTCGSVQWVRGFGSSVDDVSYGLAVDSNGDVVVTGYFRGAVDFGAGTVSSNGSFADVFVAKYTGSNGAYQWAHTLYGASVDIGRGVAVDGIGNVVVAGSFQLTISDGSTYQPLMTSAGSVDFFLLKYSPTGTYLWSRSFGGSGDDVAYGVDVDSGGNIAVVGSFQNTMDMGGGPLTSAGLSDTFIAKFSPLGSHLWSTRIGGTGADLDYAVAMDAVGNVVMTGGYQFTVGQWDIIVAKYSAAGAPLWSKTYGSSANDVGFGIAVDQTTGNVFATGYFQGTINFGAGPIYSGGLTDGFLLSLGP
ncbi:MAG: PKD domain-containing protein [Vicinamibacterales bacterium]